MARHWHILQGVSILFEDHFNTESEPQARQNPGVPYLIFPKQLTRISSLCRWWDVFHRVAADVILRHCPPTQRNGITTLQYFASLHRPTWRMSKNLRKALLSSCILFVILSPRCIQLCERDLLQCLDGTFSPAL